MRRKVVVRFLLLLGVPFVYGANLQPVNKAAARLAEILDQLSFLCPIEKVRACAETCIAQGAWNDLSGLFLAYDWLEEFFVDLDETGHCVNALLSLAAKYNEIAQCEKFLRKHRLSDFQEEIPDRFRARTFRGAAPTPRADSVKLVIAESVCVDLPPSVSPAVSTSRPYFRSQSEIADAGDRRGDDTAFFTLANNDGEANGDVDGLGDCYDPLYRLRLMGRK